MQGKYEGDYQLKLWYQKEKPPISMITERSAQFLTRLPNDIQETIQSYMAVFDRFKEARRFQTDNFTKEVYYATTQDRTFALSLDKMESRVAEINQTRLKLVSYEIDEATRIGSTQYIIGITREFSDMSHNRVLYILQKEAEGEWKFHHIARSHQGTVLDKFQVAGQMGFVIGNLKSTMLFITPSHMPEATLAIGEYVHAEGYLEVQERADTEFYYRIVRMNRVH